MKHLHVMFGLLAILLAGYQSGPATSAETQVNKKMTVNGTSLAYVEQGKGAPVVFVHGAFSDLRAWEPQREAVASRYRFISYTQRSFGKDVRPDTGVQYSRLAHAEDLAAFIRQLNAGPVYVVGRSYGATVAMQMALQHPELVRGLFVHEPTIAGKAVTDPGSQTILKKERAGLASVREAVKDGNATEATRLFADWTNDQPGGFDALPPEARAMHLDNAHTVALHFERPAPPKVTCSDLGQLKMPLGITTGELTRPFFKILAETAHRCVPGSRIIPIPGARHAATVQNPTAFNEALLTFLSTH